MGTYLSGIQVDQNNPVPFGSTLFGICESLPGSVNKYVTLEAFDKLVNGVTIVVKFINGNNNNTNARLQVGGTQSYPIRGDCRCASGEVISFTFEGSQALDQASWYWYAHTSGLSDTIKNYIINAINTSTDTPNVLIFKGSVGANGDPGVLPPSDYEAGWTYLVKSAGIYFDQYCEVGALIIAIADAKADQESINPNHWTVFTTKNYLNGVGLNLDPTTNTFSVKYGDTGDVAAPGNHTHDSLYASINHSHGIIHNDGTVGNVNTNALLSVNNGVISTNLLIGNDNSLFLSNAGTWEQAILSINGKTPDRTGSVTLSINDFGIGQVMHFIGIVSNNSTYTPSDGGRPQEGQTLVIDNYPNYEPQPGDIIIDQNEHYEYIYTASETWEALGPEGVYKTLQTEIAKPSVITNKWVSAIGQNANGEISVEYSELITSGRWTGSADSLTTPKEIYVNLSETRETEDSLKVKFNGTEDIAIQVSGVLPVSHGGTGMSSISGNGIVFIENNAFTTKLYKDITFTNTDPPLVIVDPLEDTSELLITERAIYYGLPTINGTHDYTSNTNYYVPTTHGEQNQILISNYQLENGELISTAPVWAQYASIVTSTLLNGQITTSLILGGQTTNIDNETINVNGSIELYSHAGGIHIIQADNTQEDVIHHLPGETGYLIQTSSIGAVGSNDNITKAYQPVYINTNGVITAITFATNRLYYSDDGITKEPSQHYIDTTRIGINSINWPTISSEPMAGVLYVNGISTFTGVLNITNTTSAAVNGTGALVVNGGIYAEDNLIINNSANIGDELNVTGATTLGSTLDVTDATVLNSMLTVAGPVGINIDPDDSTVAGDYHILNINGSIALYYNDNIIAHLDSKTASNNRILQFFPETAYGYIGLLNNQWNAGYFSNEITVGTYNNNNNFINGVSLDGDGTVISITTSSNSTRIIELETQTTGQITITSAIPTIMLSSGLNNWTITNNGGIFNLTNEDNTPTALQGNTYGFSLTKRLYINSDPLGTGDNLDLYVNGLSELLGNTGIGIEPDNNYKLTINGAILITELSNEAAFIKTREIIDHENNSIYTVDFYPNTDNTGFLGLPTNNSQAHRWAGVYIGTHDTYGDEYTPVYWNDGVPTEIAVVQKYTFTISGGGTTAIIDPINTNKAKSIVTEIVVDTGIEYLNDKISWAIPVTDENANKIVLTTAITSGIVSGYILVSIGP